ncbi:glycosyltransferase family 4 protein [Tessaracoccus sp. OS52]|uniref:glycosyltransferase family 4 protein n=1 Tax=Tessaracoccus sp. OS52 TaxID=2886691 RepID=UPI001D105917|nr:glycosyltransferase family 4 protein [Tessaracoccus sp. OS52]MCC2594330.1 glycosyltransferase family 4 protein [Tessaracoccus sp. OS52]
MKPNSSDGGNRDSLTLDFTSVAPDSGGVGVVASGVAQGLRSCGVPFRCLVDSGSHQSWVEGFPDLADVLVSTEIHLAATSDWQRSLRRLVPRSSWLAQELIGRVRQIRARSSSRLIGQGVVWQPFHRAPITTTRGVVTVHDLRVFEPGLASVMDQRIIEHNVREAAAVICSWPHPYYSLIERFPFAQRKTFLVPLPVLNPGPWQTHVAPRGDAFRILLPGFITPHKNHEVLIRALPELAGGRVVFTGSEDGTHGYFLRDLAQRLGVSDRIEWLGFVESERLEAEYARADLMVMPTRWEAASGPVFESILRGLPFVTSDIPPLASQLAELRLDGATFDPDSPEDLAGAVRATLASYDETVSRLRPVAEDLRVRSWADMAHEYNRIFNWVAGTADKPTELMKGAIE